uniref:SAM-dependent methyltransferase n=1 Tax=Ascaris lumbricoides TaxID=6252 RepID=A0A0M3HHW7_ASCLU
LFQALGVEVYDPNSPDFPTPRELPSPVIDHPAFKVNTPQVLCYFVTNAFIRTLFDMEVRQR